MQSSHQSDHDDLTTPESPAPRVLHVSQPGSEGVANYVAALGLLLAAGGQTVAVAGPADSPLHDRLLGTEVVYLPWDSSRNPFDGLGDDVRRLRGIITSVQPDVVHLHSSKAGIVGRLAIRGGIPTVFQPHAWSFEALHRPLDTVAARWERYAGRWTHALVTVSERELAIGRSKGIGATRLTEVVVNPVDVSRFRPAVGVEWRSRLPPAVDGDSSPIVICVGRLCRQKGQDVLLRSWPLVRAEVPEARLLLVGAGPLQARLESLADDSVIVVGNSTDVDQLLRGADLMVMPSRWEGMALAMLEAMASGLSIVASNVGGVSETVGQGAGAVVPIGDHRRLAEAIVARLLDDELRRREGRVGRQLVLDGHSWEQTAKRLSAIYRFLNGASTNAASISSVKRVFSR